nr:hypothetical protein [Flavivirga sp. MEBiC07777]
MGESLDGALEDLFTPRFFLILAPFLFIVGRLFESLAYKLHFTWEDEKNRGIGYRVNQLFSLLKCDFSDRPTLIFMPMHISAIFSLLISFIIWTGIFG